MDKKIEQATAWLADQAARIPYGEISIKIIIHDGSIQRIEKSFLEKDQVRK